MFYVGAIRWISCRDAALTYRVRSKSSFITRDSNKHVISFALVQWQFTGSTLSWHSYPVCNILCRVRLPYGLERGTQQQQPEPLLMSGHMRQWCTCKGKGPDSSVLTNCIVPLTVLLTWLPVRKSATAVPGMEIAVPARLQPVFHDHSPFASDDTTWLFMQLQTCCSTRRANSS